MLDMNKAPAQQQQFKEGFLNSTQIWYEECNEVKYWKEILSLNVYRNITKKNNAWKDRAEMVGASGVCM